MWLPQCFVFPRSSSHSGGKILRGRKLSIIWIPPLHMVILIEGRGKPELSLKELLLVLAWFELWMWRNGQAAGKVPGITGCIPLACLYTELAVKVPTSYFRIFEVLKKLHKQTQHSYVSVLSSKSFILMPSPRDGWIQILQFSGWSTCSPAQQSVFIPSLWSRLLNLFFSLKVDHWAVRKGADEEFTTVSITLNVPPYAFFIFLNYCLVSNKSTGQEAEP